VQIFSVKGIFECTNVILKNVAYMREKKEYIDIIICDFEIIL